MQTIAPKISLRLAVSDDQEKIWEILQYAILKRKDEGSNQWQNGYPNAETVSSDLLHKYGYVLEVEGKIAAYSAVIFDIEPNYEVQTVSWFSNGKYAVVHRVAVSQDFIGQGIAQKLFLYIEDLVKSKGFFSIKVDTNFDNIPMLKIFEKLNYQYCGDVLMNGSPRRAFEKILD